MSPSAYSSTDVAVNKSQQDIRGLLRKYGADQFTMGEGTDWVGLEFIHHRMRIRMRAKLHPYSEEAVRARVKATHSRRLTAAEWPDQEAKRVWRVIRWTLEARLVSVDEDLETFEQAFLPYIVDPASDRTVWEGVQEVVESGALEIGAAGLRQLGPGR